jgi:hypothetical protein
MQVDISFDFARVYNFERADVMLGQKFRLDSDAQDQPLKWFSDNDPVLTLKVTGNSAEGTADNVGTTTILIMDQAFAVVKQLTINVVEDIQPMATSLGASAGEAVPK